MAIGDISNRKCKMTLRQEIATDTYANQSLSNINPSVTDDKFLYFGNIINGFTDKTLSELIRVQTYDIATA